MVGVMTTAAPLRTGPTPHHQGLPGLSLAALPSTGQPIQYARSTCEAGVAKLHIQDALPEDDGTYTCLAENTLGRVSCSARVTVHGRNPWAPLEKHLSCQHICFGGGALHLKAGGGR